MTLYESGAKLRYAYFPTTSIVSLLYVMENGASAEIAIVGNEVCSGSPCSWWRHHAQPRGGGAQGSLRLKADLLKNEFGRFS